MFSDITLKFKSSKTVYKQINLCHQNNNQPLIIMLYILQLLNQIPIDITLNLFLSNIPPTWYHILVFCESNFFMNMKEPLLLFNYCCCSVFKWCLFATPWTAARQASLSFTISQNLLKLMATELVTPSNHLILCHPLFLLPSILPSIRVFSSELAFHTRWPKYWSSVFYY